MNEYPFVQPGYILEGKYSVERVIGAGGMGVVVAAKHLAVDEPVAIKFMLPEHKKDESPARFLREAKMAIKLKSEHVARVMDVGTLPTGELYIVMEYLEGHDLSAFVLRGLAAHEQAVEYILQACEALAEAHAFGIVHRDIKPANLFLTRRPNRSPCIKVLDFGISKLGPAADVTITLDTAALGTPLYMSPEQIRSAHEVDARADIWSLGVVLYQLLSGSPPFETSTVPKLFYNVIEKPHAPLRQVAPHVPVKLEEIVNKCLEKDPANRFQDIATLADALLEFAHRSRRFERSSIGTFTPILPSVVDSADENTPYVVYKIHHVMKTLARTTSSIKPKYMRMIEAAIFVSVGAIATGFIWTRPERPALLSRIKSSIPVLKLEESSSAGVQPAELSDAEPVVAPATKTNPSKPAVRPPVATTTPAPAPAVSPAHGPKKDDREVTRK